MQEKFINCAKIVSVCTRGRWFLLVADNFIDSSLSKSTNFAINWQSNERSLSQRRLWLPQANEKQDQRVGENPYSSALNAQWQITVNYFDLKIEYYEHRYRRWVYASSWVIARSFARRRLDSSNLLRRFSAVKIFADKRRAAEELSAWPKLAENFRRLS